jgi:hypothetical protein
MTNTAICEKQKPLFDVYLYTTKTPYKGDSITSNEGVYLGYYVLYKLLTHPFPDEVIDDKKQEAFSRKMMLALKRATYVLTTSHTSISNSPCYVVSGLMFYNNHVCSHAQQGNNKEYVPKRYGIGY